MNRFDIILKKQPPPQPTKTSNELGIVNTELVVKKLTVEIEGGNKVKIIADGKQLKQIKFLDMHTRSDDIFNSVNVGVARFLGDYLKIRWVKS
jgi:hypothetical protein